jgi:hypothetical protein
MLPYKKRQKHSPVIDMVRGALANIVKLCRTSSKLNGGGAGWVKIMEEAEEVRTAACQHLDGKEFIVALPECYTSTQLRMLNSSVQHRRRHAQYSSPSPSTYSTGTKANRDHSSSLRKSKEEVKLVRGLGTTTWDKEGRDRSGLSTSLARASIFTSYSELFRSSGQSTWTPRKPRPLRRLNLKAAAEN